MKWGLQFLERRTLGTKLLLGFVVLLIFALMLGVSALLTQRSLVKQVTQLYHQDLLGVSNAKDAEAAYITIGRELRQALISRTEEDRRIAVSNVVEQDRMLRREIAELRPRVVRPENMQRLAGFEDAYATYKRNVDRALSMLDTAELQQARTFVGSREFQSAGDNVRIHMDAVVQGKEAGASEGIDTALTVAGNALERTVAMLVGGLAVGGYISWLVAASIRRPALRVRDAVEQLAKGKLFIEVPHQDFGNELGELARSVRVLQRVAQQMDNQTWIKSHLVQIANALQMVTSEADLSHTLFTLLAPVARLGAGSLYVYEEDTHELRLAGAYVDGQPASYPHRISSGQGLAGQCAQTRQPMVLCPPPAAYTSALASRGSPTAETVALYPLMRGDRLLGVLEVAILPSQEQREQALVNELKPVLIMKLEILERAQRSRRLLDETQRQAQELRDQTLKLEKQSIQLETQKSSLQATETWYRGIIASAPDGMLVVDADGLIILANCEAEAMFGYDAGALAGQAVEVLVPPSGRSKHAGLRTAFSHEGGARIMGAGDKRLRGVRKDGTDFPVEVGLARLPDVIGRSDCVCASVRDVSDRQRAERELAKTAQRLSFALRGGNLGLWDWDVATSRNEVNDIWAQMLGYTLDEIEHDGDAAGSWARLLHPEDAEGIHQEFQRFIKDPRQDEFQALFRMMAKTGDWRWILSIGRATERDETGQALRIVGIHQDFTDRKNLQDEMARAKATAEEATQAKSSFLANMSHEIRTPMNAIIGMSHLALQTALDKKQRNYIEKVHRSGENLLGIINDILDFSKIEAGRLDIEEVDFHLEDVMENLANLVGLKADEKELELLFNIGSNVPTSLRGDPLRLGQILVNLGNNAVKFTERGEVVVGIESRHMDAQKVELHFWVADTGIGMTQEQSSRMFESFAQADASTTRRFGGTGLGLAISKSLVQKMQGNIWVNSELGRGSTFHFTIPIAVQGTPRPARMFIAKELLGVRVLVVDDNASAREILATMASSFGLEVDVAREGREALRMISIADQKQLGYDVVIMDWKMPGMGGIETMRQLKAERYRRMPTVVMVTSYGRHEAMDAARQEGVAPATVLTKPVTASTLLEAVAEALGKPARIETHAMAKASFQSQTLSDLNGARLLLVEDNDLNQELAMDLLRNVGVDVVCAGNGQEALDTLERDADFDCILMDCQMPVMDGYEATAVIRSNSIWAELPIIAMTANALAGDRERVLSAGMSDHIAKPLNVDSMFSTIARWIRPGTRGSALPPAATFPACRTSISKIPELPGIHVSSGLTTSANDTDLYRRLLLKFHAGHRGFAQVFETARTDIDPTAARRVAHSLKGSAGNIGAISLARAAAELESACQIQSKPFALDAALSRVLTELQPVIVGLSRFAKWNAPAIFHTAQKPPGNHSALELRLLLDRLAPMLEQGDADAEDVVDDLLRLAEGANQATSLRRLAAAVSAYDFDAAQEILRQLAHPFDSPEGDFRP
jgi:PAS domain S-box-containing protein